jgi:hypothetical protein
MSLNNFTGFKNPSHYTVNTFAKNGFDGTNFNNAFKNQATLIPPRDTKNYGNTIINNLNENIVNEIITEYTLHIDSCDRDVNLFPNPYQFTVSIGGAGSSTITQTNTNSVNNINNKNGVLFNSVSYSGAPGPRIDTQFRNVKYIKLKYITLPRIILYENVVEDGKKIYTASSPLTNKSATILGNYRYLIMRIREIANDNFYSTNADIKNNCFILYRDSNYLDAVNDLWIATQPIKIFYDDDLKNLSKMSIEIFLPPNPKQQPVTTGNQPVEPQTNAGVSYDIQKDYNKTYGYLIPQDTNLIPFTLLTLTTVPVAGTKIPIQVSDVNGTSGSSSDFYSKYGTDVQMSMEFELGVCENQMNTGKNYR